MKVLIAGLGSVGQRHARNLRSLLGDDLELLAYRSRYSSPAIRADLTVDTAVDAEAELGVCAFDDLDAALAERPDAVVVANPSHLHVPVALAGARAGAHLLVEKPLSHTLDGVDELGAAVDAAGVACIVGYQLRFDPGFQLVQQLVRDGGLGTLLAARISYGEYLPGWHPYEDYRLSYAARAEQGGGVVLTQIHDLDLTLALFGVPRRVFAVGGKRSSLEIDVEDVVEMQLDFDGLPVHIHQDFVRHPPVRTYEILGEAGSVLWDQRGGTVAVTRDGETDVHALGHDRNEPFVAELRHFLACIAGSERPVVGLAEAAASLRVALAAKRSLSTGEAVALA
jgi:predicted dehydrogenase